MRSFLRLAGGCLAIAAIPAAAQQTAPAAVPTVILFVGNSYTQGAGSAAAGYHCDRVTDEVPAQPIDGATPAAPPAGKVSSVGGVPALFKQFADEAGLSYEVHLETSGGKSLEWHYQNAHAVIAQPKWNAVVLQGYSTESIPAARGGKPENFVSYATRLEEAVHKANPDAKLYLYETFPRADQVYPDKGAYHGASVDAMAADLHDGYLRAFAQDGRFEAVAPAGDAWRTVLASGLAQLNPYLPPEPGQVNLWAKDSYHASVYGYYLNALVIFQTITGRSAAAFGADEQAARDLGIAPEVAVKLQGIADETVRSGPHARR